MMHHYVFCVQACSLLLCSRLDNSMDNMTVIEIQDVCSITLDKSPCGVRFYLIIDTRMF